MELTVDQINKLNAHQNAGRFHPYTCDRHANECDVKIEPRDYSKDGIMIATSTQWVCPCGRYTQSYRGEQEIINRLNTDERKGIFD